MYIKPSTIHGEVMSIRNDQEGEVMREHSELRRDTLACKGVENVLTCHLNISVSGCYYMVLGPTESQYPFVESSGALGDQLGDLGRANERHTVNPWRVDQSVHLPNTNIKYIHM